MIGEYKSWSLNEQSLSERVIYGYKVGKVKRRAESLLTLRSPLGGGAGNRTRVL